MSNTPEFNTEQLSVARAKAWHQNAEPLLTLDAVRDWITASGLVLFAPRTQQLPAPAPTLVEATLGASSGGPTPAQIDTARSLVARLVSEGNALPLNLLGGTAVAVGDIPDFVVSAQVFSYVFTLRGDKLWKQPPTSGSPLGLRIFEVLGEKGALSASELASELGRELTEAAVLRALNELWSNLRVLPLLQQGSGPTLWELTSRRFTKAIKAGINAGQPTALSALISLYLAQALLATEEDIETFLSPLAARSRIREVVHALNSSRQLETIVLEGKSLLHVPGTLPEFPAIEKPEPTGEANSTEVGSAESMATPAFEGEGRIKKFTGAKSGKTISDFKGKPARSFGAGARPSTRPSTSRFAGKSDRPPGARSNSERRPFRRDAAEGAGAKPSFTRPWNEDRKPSARNSDDRKPYARKPYTPRAEGDSAPAKRPYVRREGSAPSSGFAKRPYTPRTEGGSAPKRPFVRREGSAPASGFIKRPYTPRAEGDSAPAKRPYVRREGSAPSSGFAKRPYAPREGGSSDRPTRPSFGGKPSFGSKPSFGAKRTFGAKPAFSKPRFAKDGDRKPYARRDESTPSDRPKPYTKPTGAPDAFAKFRKPEPESRKPAGPTYGGSDSQPRAPKRPFPRKEGDLADRPIRPWVDRPDPKPARKSGDFAKRPSRGKFGAKPAGAGFTKRPGGKVPFGSKPSFGKRPASGFKPAARKPKSEPEE